MKTVKLLWEEILEIMEENIKPFSVSALEGPASLAKIKEIEEEMNVQFPKELKALYLSNNGTVGLPAILGFELIPLEDMLAEWKNNKKLLNDDSYKKAEVKSKTKGSVNEVLFDEKWIPFATNNVHTYLAIDLNPGVNGLVGQVINCGFLGNEVKYVLAENIETLLKDTIMIYEYNSLKIEDEIEIAFEREDETVELVEFLDNHFFNIPEYYKAAQNAYEELELSYNSREYDDYQEEDGYEEDYEDEYDDLVHYKEYDGYGIEDEY